MERFENPALKAFVAQISDTITLGQVLIKRQDRGYKLRHLADRNALEGSLRPAKPDDARALAQYTANGAFRPLKAAPDLTRGWRVAALGNAELETALRGFYPGAIADWHSARSPNPLVTDYREFTNRQSGMYRITTILSDAAAGAVVRAGCNHSHCLKRRLWTVGGREADPAADKSIIPCLEPCAVLLELARKAARTRRETEQNIGFFTTCAEPEID